MFYVMWSTLCNNKYYESEKRRSFNHHPFALLLELNHSKVKLFDICFINFFAPRQILAAFPYLPSVSKSLILGGNLGRIQIANSFVISGTHFFPPLFGWTRVCDSNKIIADHKIISVVVRKIIMRTLPLGKRNFRFPIIPGCLLAWLQTPRKARIMYRSGWESSLEISSIGVHDTGWLPVSANVRVFHYNY